MSDTTSGQGPPTLVPYGAAERRRPPVQAPLVPGIDQVLDAFGDGVIIVATDGRVLETNARFWEMTGFSREELIGRRPPYPFWPAEHASLLQSTLLELLQGERSERDVVLARKSGERFPAILTSGPRRGGPQLVPGIVVTVKDAVVRRRAEEQRAEVLMEELASRAEAELLNEIAAAAAGEDRVENVLAVTLDRLAGIVRFTGGSIALVEQDELVLVAARGRFSEQALGQRLPRGRGMGWQIVESRTPFFSNDLLETSVTPLSRDGEETMRSYIAVPLVWRGEAIGLLEVDSTSPHAFRERDLALLQSVAAALSGPIQLARRHAAETRALEESERARSRLAFLAEASRILASSLDYPRTLRDVARLAVPLMADVCTVGVAASDGEHGLFTIAHADGAAEEKLRGLARRHPLPGGGRDPLQAAVSSGQPILQPELDDAFLEQLGAGKVQLEELKELGFRSAIVVPLLARSDVIGRIGLGFSGSGRRYGRDDLEMAEELARRVATAVDNARLYEAEQRARRAAEQAADRTARLQSITSALSGTLTRPQVASVIVEQATTALGAAAGSVVVLETGGQLAALRTLGYPAGLTERLTCFPLGSRLPVADAARTGDAVFVESADAVRRDYPDIATASEASSMGAEAALPLLVEDRSLGAVGLSFSDDRAFSPDDRAFMLAVAQQCAQALERARLFEAEQEAQRRVAFLAEASAVLGSSLDYHQTLGQLTEMTVHAFADACSIDIVDPDGTVSRAATASARGTVDPPETSSAELVGEVLRTGQATLVAEVPGGESATRGAAVPASHLDFLRSLGARSAMIVPLPVRRRILGAMTLVSTTPGRAYGGTELALATELARRAAAAVDAARIYERLSEFKTTLDTTLDGLYMFDPETLRFFYVNDGAVDGSGYTREELLTMTPHDLQPEFDETSFRALLQPLLDGSMSATTLATTHRRKDGSDVPVELFLQYVRPAGVRGRVIMTVRDISDRVEARERLQRLALAERALNAELTTIIRAMGDGVLVFDSDGRTIFSNPAADALFPDAGPAGFEHVLESFDDPDRRAPALGSRTSQGPVELALRGSQRWFELTAYPVFTPAALADALPARDVVETILFIREVTEARRAQMARDAFIGVLSHELRTPVTTIYGNSKLLVRGDRQLDPEASREAHRDIEVESERLYRLVEDLLVLARYGQNAGRELANEPLLLQRIVPAVMRSEQERWPYTRFEPVIPANLPAVQGDQTYVEQVIRNLLSNAAKYSGAGGRVRAVLRAEGDEATVRVLDEGPGFAPEEADHLFELFYRSPSTADKASGAGIGLFVCRLLVEAMGGRIWGRPRPAGGAEFGFVLKLAIEEGA